MAEKGKQVINGKAFEYALVNQYDKTLSSMGVKCLSIEETFRYAKECYYSLTEDCRKGFDAAAYQTIDTMIRIEPCLMRKLRADDTLFISLNSDSDGEDGDVRDVVFRRFKPDWEMGFSAKNNNDAVKHSRLSSVLDFGLSWVGVKCSQEYWEDIAPIFDFLKTASQNRKLWEDLGEDKIDRVYLPLLEAFRLELLRINANNDRIPQKLVQYLIGTKPFYKVIKDDAHNLVIVKAFNVNGELNKQCRGVKSQYSTPRINLPERIVEFELKKGSDNTLNMILDGGWEISFRIHNASSRVEQSLKFDIKLLGNPPVLFTQYLFK